MRKFLRTGVSSILCAATFALPSPAQQKHPCDEALTQHEMNQCALTEYRLADAALNKIYQQVVATTSGGERAKLRAAQLAWIKFRDAECEYESAGNEGGSIYPLVFNGCLRRQTEDRTAQLKEILRERAERE